MSSAQPDQISHTQVVQAVVQLDERLRGVEQTVLEQASLNQRLHDRVQALEMKFLKLRAASTPAMPFAGEDLPARLQALEAQMESLTFAATSFQQYFSDPGQIGISNILAELDMFRRDGEWAKETLEYLTKEMNYWKGTWQWTYHWGKHSIEKFLKKGGSGGGSGEWKDKSGTEVAKTGTEGEAKSGSRRGGDERTNDDAAFGNEAKVPRLEPAAEPAASACSGMDDGA